MLGSSVVASGLAEEPKAGSAGCFAMTLLAVSMPPAGLATAPARVAVLGFIFLFGLAGIMARSRRCGGCACRQRRQGGSSRSAARLPGASLPVSYAIAGPAGRLGIHARAIGRRRALFVQGRGPAPARAAASRYLLMCAGAVKRRWCCRSHRSQTETTQRLTRHICNHPFENISAAKRSLLTGGTGFLGKVVLRAAARSRARDRAHLSPDPGDTQAGRRPARGRGGAIRRVRTAGDDLRR